MCCINVFVFKQAPLLLLMVSFRQEFEGNLLDGAAQEHKDEAVKGGIVPAKRGLNGWQDCLKPGEGPTNLKAMKQAKDRFRKRAQGEIQKSKKGTRPMLAFCFAFLCFIYVLQWVGLL